jgi:hypothetical protein
MAYFAESTIIPILANPALSWLRLFAFRAISTVSKLGPDRLKTYEAERYSKIVPETLHHGSRNCNSIPSLHPPLHPEAI